MKRITSEKYAQITEEDPSLDFMQRLDSASKEWNFSKELNDARHIIGVETDMSQRMRNLIDAILNALGTEQP